MIEFEIRNIDQAVAAVDWCYKHCSENDWALSTLWPGVGTIFTFRNSATAEFFALKWL